jgi:phage shock protein PspC (stress-responsive transcriptional regulator)
MKTNIVKREYSYLIIIILHLIFFYSIRQYLIYLDSEIKTNIEILYNTVDSPTIEQYNHFYDAKETISVYFSILILVSSLLITSVLLSGVKIHRQKSFGKNKEKKIIGGVIAGFSSYFNLNLILCRIVFAILLPSIIPVIVYLFLWGLLRHTNYNAINKKKVVIENNGFLFVPILFMYIVICFNDVFNYPIKDKYLMSYFIFIPYLYVIYDRIIVGKQIDISEEIQNKIEISYKENLDDLDSLLKLELISQDEYNEKKEFRVKEKIRIEIEDTEEYSLLIKSKQKGLLSEAEFKAKLENLVDKKYKTI